MKNFYIHVGLPRCASTLIEHVFLRPHHQGYRALHSGGIMPLPRLYKELRRAYRTRDWDESFLRHLREYHLDLLLSHDFDAFFTSDEGLTGIDDAPGIPTHFRERAGFVARMLEGFTPHVILIVRKQPDYVESMYGLHLQNKGQMDVQEYLEKFPLNRLDWLEVAEAFADAVGKENLTVIPFERSLHGSGNGGAQDFLEALQTVLGVSQPIRLAELPLVNPSLAPRYFATLLAENRAAARGDALPASGIPTGEEAYKKQPGERVIQGAQAEQILAAFSDSNRLLFDKFMPGYDAAAYQPGAVP